MAASVVAKPARPAGSASFGRDYRDVPPVSGVIYTEGATASLKVQVDVAVV